MNKIDESSLARWGLCIHELTSTVSEYEIVENSTNSLHESQRHHKNFVPF